MRASGATPPANLPSDGPHALPAAMLATWVPCQAALRQAVRDLLLVHVARDVVRGVQASRVGTHRRVGRPGRVVLVPNADDPRPSIGVEERLVQHVDAVVDDRDQRVGARLRERVQVRSTGTCPVPARTVTSARTRSGLPGGSPQSRSRAGPSPALSTVRSDPLIDTTVPSRGPSSRSGTSEGAHAGSATRTRRCLTASEPVSPPGPETRRAAREPVQDRTALRPPPQLQHLVELSIRGRHPERLQVRMGEVLLEASRRCREVAEVDVRLHLRRVVPDRQAIPIGRVPEAFEDVEDLCGRSAPAGPSAGPPPRRGRPAGGSSRR